jgi:hypothetical protein
VIVSVLEAPLVVAPKETTEMTATVMTTVTETANANVTVMSIGRGTGGGEAGALRGGGALPLIGEGMITRVLLRWKITRKMMIAICSRVLRIRTRSKICVGLHSDMSKFFCVFVQK